MKEKLCLRMSCLYKLKIVITDKQMRKLAFSLVLLHIVKYHKLKKCLPWSKYFFINRCIANNIKQYIARQIISCSLNILTLHNFDFILYAVWLNSADALIQKDLYPIKLCNFSSMSLINFNYTCLQRRIIITQKYLFTISTAEQMCLIN